MMNFQGWLDRVAQTIFENDFDSYANSVETPFVLMTTTGTLIAARPADLRSGFDQFHQMLLSQGATEMIRIAEEVRPIGTSFLIGTYETNILRNGTRLFEPFRSSLTLRNRDGVWRAACIANAMTNARWPIHLPLIDRGDDAVQ